MKTILSAIGGLVVEVLFVAIPTLLLAGAGWGLFAGPRWLGVVCLAMLGALIVGVVVYAIYRGVTIPTTTVRNWSTYGRGEKVALGCASAFIIFSAILVVIAIARVLWV